MNNNVEEEILHYYYNCDHCGLEPIWGTRFSCTLCDSYDLCENCHDLNLQSASPFHDRSHPLEALELASLGNGMTVHTDVKCLSCYQRPILGVRFSCACCSNFNLCQNCYFAKPLSQYAHIRGHKAYHKMNIFIQPEEGNKRKTDKCSWCAIEPIEGNRYKCANCHLFILCLDCYLNREQFKTPLATTHKTYHQFYQL